MTGSASTVPRLIAGEYRINIILAGKFLPVGEKLQ
jgi:hypothetical protein